MNRIMSTAHLLMEGGLSPGQQALVGDICDSSDTLLRLISDALDSSEAEASHQAPATIPFDLRLLVEETAELLRKRASNKGQSFEHRVHHEVPSRFQGDAGRLRQVLWNLGGFAIESAQGGGVVLRVGRVHEDHRSVTVRFAMHVYDTLDPGSPSGGHQGGAQKPAAEPQNARTPATGLHLTIARRLAALIGGAVVVEDEPGGLHRSWLDLTLEKQTEEPLADVPAVTHESLAGQRVLVVDPSEVMRHSMATRLGAWGCRVAEAAQAEDALALARDAAQGGDPFRFVLIERDLPLMSGEELGACLRSNDPADALHTVLLVGVGRRGDTSRARACGFNAYLPKSIDWEELSDALVEIQHLAATLPADDSRPLVTRHWLAETRRSRTQILIVEDDVVSVLVTDWALRRMGYQVRRVSSAAELRGLYGEDARPFDVVILALHLPDAPGLSLVEEIRAADSQRHSTAIVALGHAGTREERDQCHDAGVDAYVARPVDLSQLCDMVERITRTGLPNGSESDDPAPKAGASHGSPGQSSEERGRLTFRFNVDPQTGLPVTGEGAAGDPAGAQTFDAAVESAMDGLSEETSEPGVGRDRPPW
jgi:CheY-like chemotaxis protein